MTTNETTVRLPVTVTKNPGPKTGYLASYGPLGWEIEAYGDTQAEAKANLAKAIETAIWEYVRKNPGRAVRVSEPTEES